MIYKQAFNFLETYCTYWQLNRHFIFFKDCNSVIPCQFIYVKKKKMCVYALGSVWLFVTPWTIARQAPLSMEFSRQEYWSGWPFRLSGNLLDPGIELVSPVSWNGRWIVTTEPPGKPQNLSLNKVSSLYCKISHTYSSLIGLPDGSVGQKSTCKAGDEG